MSTIDLSKAYIGQIVTFRNGETDILIDVCAQSDAMKRFAVYFSYHGYPDGKEYLRDGHRYPDEKLGLDIVSLSDPIQVQVARLEGEIKGLEWAMKISTSTHDKICIMHAIDDLKEQLLTLQNSQ